MNSKKLETRGKDRVGSGDEQVFLCRYLAVVFCSISCSCEYILEVGQLGQWFFD